MAFSLRQYTGAKPFFVIAGPCVLENPDEAMFIAEKVKTVCEKLRLAPIFKASFDKANRTSLGGNRGPGMDDGLEILRKIGREADLPVLTDIHQPGQAEETGKVCQILQIPAFLCRQTDLVVAAAKAASVVNVKKGQFLSPADTEHIVKKIRQSSGAEVLLTERGTTFGYGNLVVDMRAFPIMKTWADFVVFDATHSLQLPGAAGGKTGGQREYIPHLARAAMATNAVDGIFLEVHPEPARSPSDADNILPLDQLEGLLSELLTLKQALPKKPE